jgi:hypothetical protein
MLDWAFYRFRGFLMTIPSLKSKALGDVLAANNVQTRLGKEGRMIGRILAISTVLALTSFLVAVQIGHLWSRYAQETAALGFSGIYERFQAWQAGFSDDPTAYRAAVEAQRAGQAGLVVETAAVEE